MSDGGIAFLVIVVVDFLVFAFQMHDARTTDYVNDQLWRKEMRDKYPWPQFRL